MMGSPAGHSRRYTNLGSDLGGCMTARLVRSPYHGSPVMSLEAQGELDASRGLAFALSGADVIDLDLGLDLGVVIEIDAGGQESRLVLVEIGVGIGPAESPNRLDPDQVGGLPGREVISDDRVDRRERRFVL